MKKIVTLFSLLSAFLSNAAKVEIPDPLFSCDYDSPTQLKDTVIPFGLTEDRIVKGRNGNAYHYAPLSYNHLPYAYSVLSTNVANGVFALNNFTVKGETRWRTYFRDAHVVSAWVKGRKGAELEMKVTFSNRRAMRSRIEEKWTSIVKSLDKTAKDARYVEDEVIPATVKLTGDWQRVAVYSMMDARHEQRNVGFTFATKDSSPFSLKRSLYEIQQLSPLHSRKPAPGIWVEGGRASESGAITIHLDKYKVEFPFKEGSFTAWVKYPELSNLSNSFLEFFVWDRISFSDGVFSLGRGSTRTKSPLDPTDKNWQHIAVTWSPTNAVIYRNGKEFARLKRSIVKHQPPISLLRIGAAGWRGNQMSDFILDDVALFDKTLSPEVVTRIVNEKSPFAQKTKWLTEPIGCRLFPRNEKNSRAAFTVHVPKDCQGIFNLKIGNLSNKTVVSDLTKGVNLVTIPFDARLFPTGNVSFKMVALECPKGMLKFDESVTSAMRKKIAKSSVRRLSISGTYEIVPSFDRNAFRVFNWGGSVPIKTEYALDAGMNVMHYNAYTPSEQLDYLQRKGHHYAVYLFNYKDGFNTGFDEQKIKQGVEAKLRRHAGRANWTMTMTSTEAAGIRNVRRAINLPKWVDFARSSLGFEPKGDICGPAFSLLRPKGWKAPQDGIIDLDNDLKMLRWLDTEGDPVLQVNRMDCEVAHALSPGNLVWAEPSCPYGVDMTAYWAYEYPLDRVVSRLKRSYVAAREVGTSFMPTLGMGSCPNLRANVPGCEGKVVLSHTYEEMLMKTYAVMGVTRANAMSYFDLCGWSEGEKYADKPVAGKAYAEKGVGHRFGEKMRKDLLPAFMLLQDMDTYDSPNVAVVLSETTGHTSGILWTYRGYVFDITRILFDVIPECTILSDNTLKNASKYRHIFLPSSSSIIRENYNSIMKAAKSGSKIYTDFLCRQEYPNATRFDDGKPKTNYYNNYNALLAQMGPSFERLRGLAEDIRREGRANSPAYVEETDGVLRIYPRISEGKVNTFLCLNDTRTPGPFSTYRPEAKDYMPYGKKCSSIVSLKVDNGSAIYDFMTSKKLPYEYRDGRAFLKLDVDAAEAAILCVYPSELKTLTGEFKKTSDPRAGVLRIELRDTDGNLPKGRQLVNVAISDEKGVRDESKAYKLINGVCEVPVIIPVGGENVSLTADIVERTSGLKATCKGNMK
ncbi:MAG: LamG domain-containing protein [Kiritimatiellae bacterium]|nr:LamG domain-containing protein [Kiritimatiellia bacterium]